MSASLNCLKPRKCGWKEEGDLVTSEEKTWHFKPGSIFKDGMWFLSPGYILTHVDDTLSSIFPGEQLQWAHSWGNSQCGFICRLTLRKGPVPPQPSWFTFPAILSKPWLDQHHFLRIPITSHFPGSELWQGWGTLSQQHHPLPVPWYLVTLTPLRVSIFHNCKLKEKCMALHICETQILGCLKTSV